ncbi:MAG: hypothetical protein IPN51_08830 [Chloracidobacterium sp.]|nr:hypothetical protein [Chloracidobacterium sp.]
MERNIEWDGNRRCVKYRSHGHRFAGSKPRILNTGNIAFASGSQYNVEIGGKVVGTLYDQLNVTGTVDLGDSTLNLSSYLGFVPGGGRSIRS